MTKPTDSGSQFDEGRTPRPASESSPRVSPTPEPSVVRGPVSISEQPTGVPADCETSTAGMPPRSASLSVPVPPTAGGRLSRHEVIGQGGMGVVWKAQDIHLDRWVALKRVLPTLAQSDEIVRRFLEEARAIAQLTHPNIVCIHSLGRDEHGTFIEMEYVDGPSLLQKLKEARKINVAQAVLLARHVCNGLHAAHQRGIIHRDIKPGNILLSAGGVPKLADFGLARAGAAGLQTLTGQGMGTPGYMAPEQEENAKNATAASDQFSLAATLYHLVTGSSPRRLNFQRVPTELVEVLERALEEDPANRYPNILAFRDALGDAVRKSGPAAAKPNAPKPTVDGNDLAELLRATQQRIDRGHEEAQRLFNACQDEAVLKTLAEIPEHLRDKKLETEATQRWNRTRELERLISESVRQMKMAGVKGLVEELLQLYPHRADMRKLLQQLPPEPKVVTPELLIAPFSAEVAKRAQEDWARRLGKPVEFTNRVGMKFRLIPPGEFLMGESDSTAQSGDEKPPHRVRISRPHYLGVYPVTQDEYLAVLKTNPSHFQGNGRLPVEQVSWEDAQGFLKTLMDQEPGMTYRLPTEAEWEYACRAGTTTPYWFGAALNGKLANVDGNFPFGTNEKGPFLGKTTPVGQYGANPFGLFDQHGEVCEWCGDWYDAAYYRQFANKLAIDPTGPTSPGSSRCVRGGSWFNLAVYARCSYRYGNVPANRNSYIGFRVVLLL